MDRQPERPIQSIDPRRPPCAARISLQSVEDLDASAKATRIVTGLNTRDDTFVALTSANGVMVRSADRPCRTLPL